MFSTIDTNILLRALRDDDPDQRDRARAFLSSGEGIIIPLVVLCEYVWVMRRAYKYSRAEITASLQAILDNPGVTTDRAAAAEGLRFMANGADFADGAIASDGFRQGARAFVSFDQDALGAAKRLGLPVRAP